MRYDWIDDYPWIGTYPFNLAEDSWPSFKSYPIGTRIYDLLFRAIIRSELLPGAWLSESKIAQMFDVSRQPVREAIIRLVEFGIVTTFPQRGSMVSIIDQTSVLSARYAREAIEADIIGSLARRPTSDQVKVLKLSLNQQSSYLDFNHFMIHDHRFHYILTSTSELSGMWRLVRDLKARTDQVIFLCRNEMDIERLVKFNTEIVDCISSNDEVGAIKTLRTKLREVIPLIPKAVDVRENWYQSRWKQLGET